MPNHTALGRFALNLRRQPRRTRIIAHRGFGGCRPENTMAAFRFCLGRCGMVELDLRLSADGEVVVCHDAGLARTSNAGEFAPECGPALQDALRVDAWPLARLRRLDMGGWFRCEAGQGGASRLPPYAPLGRETMPTLVEVLAWAKRHAMPLNLELKGQGSAGRDRLLVETVARRIAAFGAADLVLISSFHARLLADCLRLAPAVSRALLYDGPPPADLLDKLAALRACACHSEQHNVDAALARRLHEAGLFVNVWTVNDAARQRELADMGVDGLITDYPAEPAAPFSTISPRLARRAPASPAQSRRVRRQSR